MSNCLNCNKELIHIEGRRKKKFCNNSCRVTYWQKTHAKSNNKAHSASKLLMLTQDESGLVNVPKSEEKEIPSWKAAYNEYMKNKNKKT